MLNRITLMTLIATLIAVVGSRLLMPKAEYLPTGNSNFVIALLFPPPGYNPDEIRQIGEEFEAKLRPYWKVESGTPEAEALPGGGIRTFFYAGIGTDQVFMGLRANDNRRIRELVPVVQQMLGQVPGAYGIALQWSIFSDDASSGRSIDVDLRGPELEALLVRRRRNGCYTAPRDQQRPQNRSGDSSRVEARRGATLSPIPRPRRG